MKKRATIGPTSNGCEPDKDEVKFVIANFEDWTYALEIIKRYELDKRAKAILISPAWDAMDLKDVADWVSAQRARRANATATSQVHLGTGGAGSLMGGHDEAAYEAPEVRRSEDQRSDLAVCLVSGGMDSCVTAAIANEEVRRTCFPSRLIWTTDRSA